MKKPEMVVMVGNIGSGKSTLVKKYVSKGYICICRDALRYMIGGGNYTFDPDRTETFIRSAEYRLLDTAMMYGSNIVLDEVGMSPLMRSRYIKKAEVHDYKIIAHVMPRWSKKVCIKRRLQNDHGNQGKKVWDKVWDNFNKIYVPPTKKEGFHRIIKEKKQCR